MSGQSESLYEKGDFSEKVRKLLLQNRFRLVLTDHIKVRMSQRQMPEEDFKENLNNPKRLYAARKRKKSRKNEESYQCYFKQSNHLDQVYGLAFNFRTNKLCLITAFKGRPKLQKMVKYGKN